MTAFPHRLNADVAIAAARYALITDTLQLGKPEIPPYEACSYRDGQYCCGIGAGVPDDVAIKWDIGGAVGNLLENNLIVTDNMGILKMLQMCHDALIFRRSGRRYGLGHNAAINMNRPIPTITREEALAKFGRILDALERTLEREALKGSAIGA